MRVCPLGLSVPSGQTVRLRWVWSVPPNLDQEIRLQESSTSCDGPRSRISLALSPRTVTCTAIFSFLRMEKVRTVYRAAAHRISKVRRERTQRARGQQQAWFVRKSHSARLTVCAIALGPVESEHLRNARGWRTLGFHRLLAIRAVDGRQLLQHLGEEKPSGSLQSEWPGDVRGSARNTEIARVALAVPLRQPAVWR